MRRASISGHNGLETLFPVVSQQVPVVCASKMFVRKGNKIMSKPLQVPILSQVTQNFMLALSPPSHSFMVSGLMALVVRMLVFCLVILM